MRIIVEIMHPKHYHQFKNVVTILQENGHTVLFVARNKDVVFQLLKSEQIKYSIYGKYSPGLIGKFLVIPNILSTYHKVIRKFAPQLILSKASPYSMFLKLFNKYKTIVFPDSEVVFLTNRIVVPLSNVVVTPKSFQLNYKIKHLRVSGLFEESYLGPNVFTASKKLLDEKSFDMNEPYCLLRFVGWGANHDVNQGGLSDEEKVEMVRVLSSKIRVYISSEKNLPAKLKKYELTTPANLIHHVLSFANFYIGDSQTMATEAALLGTPSIRVNSFVGPNDMSNFVNLEKMGFLYNFSKFEDVMRKAEEFLSNPNAKREWKNKVVNYYESKPDINNEMYQYIIDNA